jgi:hypothetical protein
MSHNNIENYYVTDFQLIHHHKWNTSEWEEWYPYEFEFKLELLAGEINKNSPAPEYFDKKGIDDGLYY